MTNRHSAGDLAQLQSLPLDAKIIMSQQRIRAWYEHFDGMVYVAFSGGKDSTVLLHLVREIYPEVPAVFNDTGVEFPEIREFIRTFENVIRNKPKMNYRQVIERYGYPVVSKRVAQYVHEARHSKSGTLRRLRMTGIRNDGTTSVKAKLSDCWIKLIDAPFSTSHMCCKILKHQPASRYEKESGRVGFVGTMATDSEQRALTWKVYGCNAFDSTRPVSKPLSFWTEENIWEYIKTRNIPISSIYSKGYTRTGCVYCGFGAHLQKPLNRFQLLYKTHPKMWEYAMKPTEEGGLGMREPLKFIGVDIYPLIGLFDSLDLP